jgi:WD40 repeat protein
MIPSRIIMPALALVVAVPLLSPADEPPNRAAKTLGGHTGTVRVLYAPDGTLATFSDDHAVRLWDAQGHVPRRLDGHEGGVGSAAFSPDGKTLATAGGESVRLWDVAEGKPRPAKGLPAGAARLAFSPDGKTLACVVGRDEVQLWDVGTERVTRTFSGEHPKDVPVITSPIAYAPDGKTLAITHTDGHPGPSSLRLWDPSTGKLLRTPVDGVKFDIWSAAFSPDGKLLAAGDMNGVVRVFETEDWGKVAEWAAGDQLRSMAFAPDGKTLALGLRRDVQLRTATTGKIIHQFDKLSTAASSIVWSPDGKMVIAGTSGAGGELQEAGEVWVWDAGTGKALHTFPVKPKTEYGEWASAADVAITPDGKRVAAPVTARSRAAPAGIIIEDTGASVRVWDLGTGKDTQPVKGLKASVGRVIFSPDGKRLATAGADKVVRVFDAESGKELAALSCPDRVGVVAFGPDGKLLAAGSKDGSVRIWTVPAAK